MGQTYRIAADGDGAHGNGRGVRAGGFPAGDAFGDNGTTKQQDSVGPALTEDQLKLFNETMDQWQRKNDGTLVGSMGPTLLEGSTMNVSPKEYHAGDAYEIGVWCMGHGSVKAKRTLGDTLSYTTEVQCSPQIGADDSIFTGDDAKESTMTLMVQDDTMAQVAYRIIKVEDYKSQSGE